MNHIFVSQATGIFSKEEGGDVYVSPETRTHAHVHKNFLRASPPLNRFKPENAALYVIGDCKQMTKNASLYYLPTYAVFEAPNK